LPSPSIAVIDSIAFKPPIFKSLTLDHTLAWYQDQTMSRAYRASAARGRPSTFLARRTVIFLTQKLIKQLARA